MLLTHADAIADRLGLAQTQLTELLAGERARLRLGAFPSALAGLVPEALALLRDTAPDLDVSVDEAPSDEMPARIGAGELHLALAFQDAAAARRQPAGLERVDLVRENFLVAVALEHRLAGRRSVELLDLAGESGPCPRPRGS